MQLRPKVMVQHQESEKDSVSLCGLYSVNNAMQTWDFLTSTDLKPMLDRLRTTDPNRDHGHPRFGAYTTHALHLAFRGKGKQLRYPLGKGTFSCPADARASKVFNSRHSNLLVIGRRYGQQEGTWHCITRVWVGGKHVFVDSDRYHYFDIRTCCVGFSPTSMAFTSSRTWTLNQSKLVLPKIVYIGIRSVLQS